MNMQSQNNDGSIRTDDGRTHEWSEAEYTAKEMGLDYTERLQKMSWFGGVQIVGRDVREEDHNWEYQFDVKNVTGALLYFVQRREVGETVYEARLRMEADRLNVLDIDGPWTEWRRSASSFPRVVAGLGVVGLRALHDVQDAVVDNTAWHQPIGWLARFVRWASGLVESHFRKYAEALPEAD